ncbi:hypothetical protein ANN_18576 [Periplaneta americana]|uniref:CCHC-type domain-containing protein n=1 Tax=Periplaneta americana TaxID=6978 RepID=A0ABQ8SPL6_PERAM|nr:hypothetical protein ANN_18576 [Periplaneta americana]
MINRPMTSVPVTFQPLRWTDVSSLNLVEQRCSDYCARENINVREDELDTLQLVSKQNAVYIKFNNQLSYEKHLQLHTGTSTIQLMNGATTTVNITAGEFDTTTVRILNVPPEVLNDRIMHVLQTYGKVQEIINEKWSKISISGGYGIRLVNMQINKQIPSTLYIAGYEAYVVYPGQEQTCFLCGRASHIRRYCPSKGSRQIGNNNNRPFLMSDLLKPIRDLPDENHPSTVLPISEEATTSASSRTIEQNTREDGQGGQEFTREDGTSTETTTRPTMLLGQDPIQDDIENNLVEIEDSDTITADEDGSDTSNGQISKIYIEAKEPGKKRRKKNPELDQVKNDVIQINGFQTPEIPVSKSVRQGCPASMTLFILALHPLLLKLNENITGVSFNNYHLSVAAYADDVNVILANEEDIQHMTDSLHQYSAMSGLKLNYHKSHILPLGPCDIQPQVAPFTTITSLKILGILFAPSIIEMQQQNWKIVSQTIKITAQQLYYRDLTLHQRSWIVHTFLLSKCWYLAQVLPITITFARQITSAICWFLWKGSTFRVPLSTLCLQPTEGGIGLLNIRLKCMALFLSRGRKIQHTLSCFSAFWLQFWTTAGDLRNPPDLRVVPRYLKYLWTYIQEWSYLDPAQFIVNKSLSKEIYNTLVPTVPVAPLRIQRIVPENTKFTQLWKNINSRVLPVTVRSVWYTVIHDIIATKERLFKINRVNNYVCQYCQQKDSLHHRLNTCTRNLSIREQFGKYVKDNNIFGNDTLQPTMFQLQTLISSHSKDKMLHCG